jgi:hypothetical protein
MKFLRSPRENTKTFLFSKLEIPLLRTREPNFSLGIPDFTLGKAVLYFVILHFSCTFLYLASTETRFLLNCHTHLQYSSFQ